MAYDSARGVTVLFGGANGYYPPTLNDETWDWDGTARTQRTIVGPSARFNHAMAYDTARAVTVLFGGTTGGVRRVLLPELRRQHGPANPQHQRLPMLPQPVCGG